MNQRAARTLQPGDTVRIDGWPQTFGVIDVRKGRVLLQSEHGTRIVVRSELVSLEQEKTAA